MTFKYIIRNLKKQIDKMETLQFIAFLNDRLEPRHLTRNEAIKSSVQDQKSKGKIRNRSIANTRPYNN